MFAVIYRAYINAGMEEEYQKHWHKTAEGYWLAYSRWPNKATRDAAWPGDAAPSNALPESICQLILDIKACIDQQRPFPEIAMEVVDDLLLTDTKNIKQVD